MRIDVITLFPPMFEVLRRFGITGRAIERGLVQLQTWNPRDYARDRHRTVDDRPYGGGPGMVMMFEPLAAAIRAARAQAPVPPHVIYLSPQGRRLDQAGLLELAAHPALMLVCGRYEGVDERLIEAEVDAQWSIGDYVLSGGELAAMVLIDALVRWVPEAVGNPASLAAESFAEGLLDFPHYTRPEEVEGRRVPELLLTGDHGAVARWRRKQALGRTWQRRPDLLERLELDAGQRALLEEFIREQDTE